MRYVITKEFSFEAAHCLPHLPETHRCSRPHGHSYRVVVDLATTTLNASGFVVDYGDLSLFKAYLDNHLDHQDLNQVLGFPTTAENIARHLFFWCAALWPQTMRVGVSETAKTWAWVEQERMP